MATLAIGIETAVKKSFETGAVMVFQTRDEVRRRTRLCVDVARELRGDLGWSVARIADALPRALRAKLDGTTFEPEEEQRRATWAGQE